jgi:hypothetical protein
MCDAALNIFFKTCFVETLHIKKKNTFSGGVSTVPAPLGDIHRQGFNRGIKENFRDEVIIPYLNPGHHIRRGGIPGA